MEPLVERESNSETAATGAQAPTDETVVVRKSKNKTLIVAACFGLVLLGLLLIGFLPRIYKQQTLVERTNTELAQAPSVVVATARAGDSIQEFTLPGTTQAIQDAPIYARVNGYLSKRYVNIGDHVRSGQVMADIDTPEIDQQVQAAKSDVEQATANVDTATQSLNKAEADALTAKANVLKGKTDLEFATTQVGRYTGLAQQGAVSMEDRDARTQQYNAAVAVLDSLKQAEKSAQANVNSARAAVHVAGAGLNTAKAKLHQLEATRSFKRVTAPFDGVVVKRTVDAGALITAGSDNANAVLFEVAKTDKLRVFVYVPEQYVSYIHTGEKVILSFQTYPRQKFEAVVANVAGGLDAESKTLQVEIHVANNDGKLLPGMYAQCKFEAPSQFRLPLVPATTLQVRPDGGFVYVVDNQNRVHVRKMTIGRDLGGQFEVANGVNVGERVIVNPTDQLQENELVSPVAAAAPPPAGK